MTLWSIISILAWGFRECTILLIRGPTMGVPIALSLDPEMIWYFKQCPIICQKVMKITKWCMNLTKTSNFVTSSIPSNGLTPRRTKSSSRTWTTLAFAGLKGVSYLPVLNHGQWRRHKIFLETLLENTRNAHVMLGWFIITWPCWTTVTLNGIHHMVFMVWLWHFYKGVIWKRHPEWSIWFRQHENNWTFKYSYIHIWGMIKFNPVTALVLVWDYVWRP